MILLLQVAVILGLARAMRALLSPVRQPGVVSEMLAGFVIGPSLLGWIAPRLETTLFPAASLDALNALSQIGIVIFMFTVGVRVGSHSVRTNRRAAAVTSAVSITAPFVMGAALGWHLHDRIAPDVPPWAFALFVGTAMSITAFPVLARIVAEHRMFETEIGRLSLACAALDDVVGWLMLAAVLSVTRAESPSVLGLRLALLGSYLAVMTGVVRPVLSWLAEHERLPGSGDGMVAAVVIVLLLSAAATDALGIHALFGAFLAGVIMPKHARIEAATVAIEPLTTTLLLPLFFAFTGLRTSVRLIDSPALIVDTLAIIGVAILGKGGGCATAARALGHTWRDAGALGALVNTRGLVELVILNIGLEAGMLSPVAFSMLVVMTLVTTFMASPILSALLGEAYSPVASVQVAAVPHG